MNLHLNQLNELERNRYSYLTINDLSLRKQRANTNESRTLISECFDARAALNRKTKCFFCGV